MTATVYLKEATERYLEVLKEQQRSPRTLYTYGKDLEQILRFFGPDKKVEAILKPQVGKFLKSDELLLLPGGSRRADQTIQKTCRVLRQFLTWAQGEGLIESVPIPKNAMESKGVH